jgi:hypothetical protein
MGVVLLLPTAQQSTLLGKQLGSFLARIEDCTEKTGQSVQQEQEREEKPENSVVRIKIKMNRIKNDKVLQKVHQQTTIKYQK